DCLTGPRQASVDGGCSEKTEGRLVVGLVGFATREFDSSSEEKLQTLLTHDA
ncbi:Hypothetical protein FKW44_008637, partial [Caligus rogercresseyi]